MSEKLYLLSKHFFTCLTRLRADLSKLNFYKFKHKFADTMSPMCLTNDGIEDTEHFLLLCHSFDNNRRSIFAGVNEIFKAVGNIFGPNESLLQILLYGDKNLSEDANKQIFDLTIKYILSVSINNYPSHLSSYTSSK